MPNSFIDQLEQQLAARDVHPRPRWYFGVVTIIIWLIALAAVLLAALAAAVVVFMLVTHDWDVVMRGGHRPIVEALFSLPYLWLLLCAAALLGVYLLVRLTGRGYRYESARLGMTVTAIALATGAAVYAFGVGSTVHMALLRRVPPYGMLVHTKEDVWCHPDQGLLAGEVIDPVASSTRPDEVRPILFSLRDEDGRVWQVVVASTTHWDRLPPYQLSLGDRVKLVGTSTASTSFTAGLVRPWRGW